MMKKLWLIIMDMNKIGQMSCNPAVGGIAKGQIVREIDALGGEMGHITENAGCYAGTDAPSDLFARRGGRNDDGHFEARCQG